MVNFAQNMLQKVSMAVAAAVELPLRERLFICKNQTPDIYFMPNDKLSYIKQVELDLTFVFAGHRSVNFSYGLTSKVCFIFEPGVQVSSKVEDMKKG